MVSQVVALNGSTVQTVAVQGEVKQCLSLGTQTSSEQWPPQPYEHLFLAVFPSTQPGEVAVAQESFFNPSSILDQYVEIAIKEHDREHHDAKKARLQGTVLCKYISAYYLVNVHIKHKIIIKKILNYFWY